MLIFCLWKLTYFIDRSQKTDLSHFKSRHATSCPRLLLYFNTHETNTAGAVTRYVRLLLWASHCRRLATSVRMANLAWNRVRQQTFVGIDSGVNSNRRLLCYWNLLLHHKYHHPLWFCTPCEPDSYYNLPHSWLVGSLFGPCVWFWSWCVLLLTTFSQQPTHSIIYGLNRSTKWYVQLC